MSITKVKNHIKLKSTPLYVQKAAVFDDDKREQLLMAAVVI